MGRFVKNPIITSGSANSTQLSFGTTAERPGTASAGEQRFNTTLDMFEFHNGLEWVQVRGAVNGTHEIFVDAITLVAEPYPAGLVSTYTMSVAPAHERNILVYIEGVFQKHSTYTTSGNQITASVTQADHGRTMTVMHGFDYV